MGGSRGSGVHLCVIFVFGPRIIRLRRSFVRGLGAGEGGNGEDWWARGLRL